MGEGRAIGRLLVACVLSDGAPIDAEVVRRSRSVLKHVIAAADHHGVTMAVYHGLLGADLPESLRSELSGSYEAWRIRNLVMTLELARVAKVLDERNCRWLTLKGPVLAQQVYPRDDLRTYADLDLLIDPVDFSSAVEAIEELGGVGIETDWERVLDEFKGELNFALPSQVVLDVHWSLLYNAAIRSQFRWRDDEVLDRRVRVPLSPQVEVPTLNGVDTFLHLALHACIAGGQKLSWMRDISLAAGLVDSFDEVLRRAQEQRVGLAVGVMLGRVRRTLGVAPWDLSLEQGLCGRERWVDAIAQLDRVRPSERWHGGSLTGHLVSGATRSSTNASIRQLIDRTQFEIGVVRTDADHPWRRRFPGLLSFVAQPMPERRAQSPAFRDAYFAAVGHAGVGRR